MKVDEIREIAIDSAQAYYKYLDENDKGIQEVEVTELSYSESGDMLMKLRLSAKLFDIESVFFRNRKNNKKYTVSEIKIIEYDYDKNMLLIKPIESIREELKNLREQELIVISDLKFLVERVRTWYEKNGSTIAIPTISSSYAQKIKEIKYFPDLQPTPNQQDSIANILNTPFSYVWGAPGTGKTQFVLSYIVLHYIMNGDRIAILAPTNNAIEQVLRGVLKMTDKARISRKDIIRLGMEIPLNVTPFGQFKLTP
ncbi:RecG-like helicase [Parabacteroides sp. PFB2-10]|uniref:AAA domain-containing protein n=1 Tax=Parabacteroides sp. PFB2-10 TaxID=1742405 RepID=UPI0024733A07|nr:AAA domain-containing protein [Parabacteroides sp. PFB2-10]MDH6314254.1 RecG-like helicase [Parabacteroides sp. PFB2-10]